MQHDNRQQDHERECKALNNGMKRNCKLKFLRVIKAKEETKIETNQ